MLPQKCQLVIGLGRFMPWTCWEVLLGESRYYLPEKTAKQELAIFYENIECVVNDRLKKTPFFFGDNTCSFEWGSDEWKLELRIVRPLFPVSMQLRLTVEEDASCAGQYHWMQESHIYTLSIFLPINPQLLIC